MTMNDFTFYWTEGWRHIMSRGAVDHILFIAALALIHSLSDWKRVVVLVTAFTLGHALTLLLSVTDVIRFPVEWVEFLIPCTIAATAAFNLFQSRPTVGTFRLNYLMAFVFGLVHGMGYANAIRFMLAREQSLWKALLAFNLGLEVGQIFVILTVLAVSHVVCGIPGVRRVWWVVTMSSLILIASLLIAWERIPF
jgi:hypothetical protein